jgi:hypothetical protein
MCPRGSPCIVPPRLDDRALRLPPSSTDAVSAQTSLSTKSFSTGPQLKLQDHVAPFSAPAGALAAAALDRRRSKATVRGRLVRSASSPALVGTPRLTLRDVLAPALGFDGSGLVSSTSFSPRDSGRLPHFLGVVWATSLPASPPSLSLNLLRRLACQVMGGRHGSSFNRDAVHAERVLLPQLSELVHLLPSGSKEGAIVVMRRGTGRPSAETL